MTHSSQHAAASGAPAPSLALVLTQIAAVAVSAVVAVSILAHMAVSIRAHGEQQCAQNIERCLEKWAAEVRTDQPTRRAIKGAR